MITIKAKKLTPDAKLPTRATQHAAAWDLYAAHNATVAAGFVTTIETGIAVAIPPGYAGLIRGRSGLAFKSFVDVLGGVIDSDYRGEVKVALTCHAEFNGHYINAGDRIAQLLVIRIDEQELVEVAELEATERGDKGFGSTGA